MGLEDKSMERDEKKVCCIFGAGDFEAEELSLPENRYIIAADGGIYHLRRLGITPDMLLGDFDSSEYDPSFGNVVRHPAVKNDTDTFLAVEEGMKMGMTEFLIYGATGGRRLEHTIANIQMLSYFSRRGASVRLIGKSETVTAITASGERKKIVFKSGMKGYVSVFASGSDAKGVTIKGLKYELEDAVLSAEYPLGVSNEFIGKESEISLTDGALIILWH